ncbi:MAG: hypothetical protein HOW73_45980 [Polyangiaceae bacterium]|nr:hypothetical protein [Polyangiaceae bacterium]
MARRRPVSIVFYAINGRGLGHLTRLLAIARAARELLEAMDVSSEMEFVTTSEASFIADDFAVYKLPSKTAVARAGAARDRYIQRSKLLVSNLVAAQSPDLLVLDTVPYGAFQELAFLRSYARATAYIYRHQDLRSASSDLVQRHLELFDRIVVPDTEDNANEYPVPNVARGRMSFVGSIHGYDASGAWDRERVHAYFGIPHDRRIVYVAAGGGGDGRVWLDTLIRAVASDPSIVVLAGYGPLHRGDCIHLPNVVPLREGNVSRYFGGVDAAISAAGYNSFEELLAARVPTLFYAQEKGLDRQDMRIARGVEQGIVAEIAANADPGLVRGRLDEILAGPARFAISSALERRTPPEGALRAAVELLGVCASLDGSSVDRAALFELAAWKRSIPAGSTAAFTGAARAYRVWRALAATSPDIAKERDEAAASWWSGRSSSSAALSHGAALLEARASSGLDDAAWRAVVQSFATHAGTRAHERKLEDLLDAVRAVGPELARLVETQPRATLRQTILDLARERDARADTTH